MKKRKIHLFIRQRQGEEDDRFAQPEELCCGGMVREIHLPSTVQSIGNYAFYGCMNLKLFHGTDAIVRMGSGVFTGCRLEKVEIDFMDGNKSCLKEILTEIRYQIIATLRYQGTETKILFPEYYADAVENTPARIVETHYYGSGGEYRECFYRRELDYGKYDRLFALSEARDSEEAIFSVALTRLRYPWKLEDAAKLRYESYVKAHMEGIGESCIHAVKEKTRNRRRRSCRMFCFFAAESIILMNKRWEKRLLMRQMQDRLRFQLFDWTSVTVVFQKRRKSLYCKRRWKDWKKCH